MHRAGDIACILSLGQHVDCDLVPFCLGSELVYSRLLVA